LNDKSPPGGEETIKGLRERSAAPKEKKSWKSEIWELAERSGVRWDEQEG